MRLGFVPRSSRAGRSSHVIGRSPKGNWSMSRRATPLLVEDIWEAIEKIERYVAGLDHDTFIKDDKTIDSVVRNLEIIGEAANRLPENFRAQRSEIEWRKIIGLRNRIVHDYFNVDVEICGRSLRRICRTSNRSFHSSARDRMQTCGCASDAHFFWCCRRATQLGVHISGFPNVVKHFKRMPGAPEGQEAARLRERSE
jgi:uncharacterized protein with HEPN domain